jgi:hypothetical protein
MAGNEWLLRVDLSRPIVVSNRPLAALSCRVQKSGNLLTQIPSRKREVFERGRTDDLNGFSRIGAYASLPMRPSIVTAWGPAQSASLAEPEPATTSLPIES